MITVRAENWHTSGDGHPHQGSTRGESDIFDFRVFCAILVPRPLRAICVFLKTGKEKTRVLNFSWRFRRFSANKSSKQNAETEQARPQLYFAPKIIKIHLVVLENELIEVCMLISKHCQKLSRVCHALLCVLLIKRTFTKVSIHIHNLSCMKALHTRDLFWHFFGINMQTSINSFSKTAKWILMIFGAK